MAKEENPWTALKPPASDNITYLTFIESNLTEETLPELRSALQDKNLTREIGWDLVHILLPHLPAAEECLLDIAKLGNPREVVLKVSESLRTLEIEGLEDGTEADDSDDDVDADEDVGLEPTDSSLQASGSKSYTTSARANSDLERDLPLPVLQFRVLLSMLSVLHPRIKTKYPTRFLSSTLQAVLATYSEASRSHDEMTQDVIKFVKVLTGLKRPVLPPRRSSSKLLLQHLMHSAPDPEAAMEEPAAEEKTMEKKLLQSFLTHVLEDYLMSLHSIEDIPGLAWSSHLQEQIDPSHVPPHKTTFKDRALESEAYQNRLATVGSLVALSQDLDIDTGTLLEGVLNESPEITADEDMEDEPPVSPDDIPLSKAGALFLLSARRAGEVFYEHSKKTPSISIFPQHATIVQNFLGANTRAAIGLEPDALIDTILFLGLLALEADLIGEPENDEAFNEYLQNISLLSANCASPSLRYQAHYLCTTVLRSHPNDLVRLSFIKDTLEFCPFENLKVSAVSWIKGETIEANPMHNSSMRDNGEAPSIFATPVALSTLSPSLFPDLTGRLLAPSLKDSYVQFQADLSFYLAALNFYYLLLNAKHLHEPLDIVGLTKHGDVGGSYLGPLREAASKYKECFDSGGELNEGEVVERAILELGLLEDAIGRVEAGIQTLTIA